MLSYYNEDEILKYGVVAIGIEVRDIEEVIKLEISENERKMKDHFDKHFPDGMK